MTGTADGLRRQTGRCVMPRHDLQNDRLAQPCHLRFHLPPSATPIKSPPAIGCLTPANHLKCSQSQPARHSRPNRSLPPRARHASPAAACRRTAAGPVGAALCLASRRRARRIRDARAADSQGALLAMSRRRRRTEGRARCPHSRGCCSKGGDSGPAIVAGDHAESLLYERIAAGEMPPGKKKLTPPEIELLARWIDAGAKTLRRRAARHWPPATPSRRGSALALVVPADPPAAAARICNKPTAWPRRSTRFLLARLEAKGLSFGPAADRADAHPPLDLTI